MPDAESNAELGRRIVRAPDGIRELYAGHRLVVVTHGGAINALLGVLSNGELGTGHSQIVNCSLTHIHHDPASGWVVDSYNEPVGPA